MNAGARFSFTLLLLPAAMFLSRYLIVKVSGKDPVRGNNKFIRAITTAFGKRALPTVLVQLLASILTIAFGGSAGRAGPSVMIGTAVSRRFSDSFKITAEERNILKMCGISAAFSTVLGAPLTGILLSLEILKPQKRSLWMVISLALASFAAALLGNLLPISRHHIPIAPQYSWMLFFEAFLASLFFAVVGLVLMASLKLVEQVFQVIKLSASLKAGLGGLVLVIFGLLVSREYLGLGQDAINTFLAGEAGNPYGFAYKILTTAVTLGSGGTGGIFSPIFFVGASAGNTFGVLIGSDPGLFAALGIVSVLAAAVNAPISAILLSAELFGIATVPPASIVAIVGYLMTKHRRFPDSLLPFKLQR